VDDFYLVEKWWEKSEAMSYRNLNPTLFLEALASCTAITYVNGSLIGDPLDVKMFEATGWHMDEPHTHTAQSRSGEDAVVICYVHPTEFIRQQIKARTDSLVFSDTEDQPILNQP
jgi:hypothetical protein